MSLISEYITPFFKWYDRKIDGEYIATQMQFKGANEAGGNYLSRIQRAQQRTIQNKYDQTLQAVKEPNFGSFAQDNILRLLLNPFDRLVAAYQAYPVLKARFDKPGTFSHTFTEIMNEGLIQGAFKGFIYNFAQFGLVLYPSVYLANKTADEDKYFSFLATYTFLDALFYPLDTLKNILYADTLGHYSMKSVVTTADFTTLYRGIFAKLTYNLPVLSGMYFTTQVGCEVQALAAWAVALAIYPLNTTKVRSQISGSVISSVSQKTGPINHSTYRGAGTYLLLNALIGYTLRPLFSGQKLSQIETQVKAELKAQNLDK